MGLLDGGGRPRKPTADEAREAVLQRLMPKALRVLEQEIEANDQDSWRAALRLIEYGWGRPAEQADVRTETKVEELTLDQLPALRAGLLARIRNWLGSAPGHSGSTI